MLTQSETIAESTAMLDALLDSPGAALRYLVDRDAFAVVQPISTHAFVRYCAERGIRADEKRLERLERRGVFYPFAYATPGGDVHGFSVSWTK